MKAQEIVRMRHNVNIPAYRNEDAERGRFASGMYFGSDHFISGSKQHINVMKVLMGGIIVVMVYVNLQTDMHKVTNYLRGVALTNDQRCIFLIDANPQRD
jgi:hypothetical protein